MNTAKFLFLLSILAPNSLAKKYQWAVKDTVRYTEELSIDQQQKTVKFLIGLGRTAEIDANFLLRDLKKGRGFQTREVKALKWDVFGNIVNPCKIVENVADEDYKSYVQFKYGTMTSTKAS